MRGRNGNASPETIRSFGISRSQGARLWCALLGALLAWSCGQEFDLPPQPDPGRIPTPGTYNLEKVWEIDSPTDLVSQGSYLYVIEGESRVQAYLTRAKQAIHPQFVGEFEGLIRPTALCLARRDSTYIIVADEGDTTVKRYLFTGGAPRFAFRDTIWDGDFTAIAADQDLNVYLSFAERDTILKYDAEGHRTRLISDRGTGTGFVISPNGLHWNGEHLLVADTGKDWVQRLRGDTTNVAAPGDPLGIQKPLSAPRDVSADRLGEFIYVADSGRDRVLKFLRTGSFVDSIYSPTKESTLLEIPIDNPRFLAVEDSLVFIADPENNRVVAFRLATL